MGKRQELGAITLFLLACRRPLSLFDFLVSRMLPAKLAKLVSFQPIRVVFFVLHR
jgi:hypothetical protein